MLPEANDSSEKRAPGTSLGPKIDSIDLVAVWHSVRNGRRTIFATTLAGLLLAGIIAFLIPKYYTATASFIAPSSQGSAMSSVGAQFGIMSAFGSFKNPADQYVSILMSRTIADDMITRFNLQHVYGTKRQSQTEKALAGQTLVTVGTRDGIIRVSVTDSDPRRAADMANAYLDELHIANGRLALTESSQRRLFFEQQMMQEKAALDQSEDELRKMQEQTGLIAPGAQTSINVQSVASTRADIEAREVQLSGLLQGSTEQDPTVIRLRSEIASLEGQLSRMIGGASTSGGISSAKVPSLQLDYERKQREVSYHTAIYDILSRQYEAARLDESHDAPTLQVIDPAVLPDYKAGPHRAFIMLIGMLAGAILSTLWLIVRGMLPFLSAYFTA